MVSYALLPFAPKWYQHVPAYNKWSNCSLKWIWPLCEKLLCLLETYCILLMDWKQRLFTICPFGLSLVWWRQFKYRNITNPNRVANQIDALLQTMLCNSWKIAFTCYLLKKSRKVLGCELQSSKERSHIFPELSSSQADAHRMAMHTACNVVVQWGRNFMQPWCFFPPGIKRRLLSPYTSLCIFHSWSRDGCGWRDLAAKVCTKM